MSAPNDNQLQQQLDALLAQAGIPLGVEVKQGVAQLTGLVQSPELHQAALDLARMVDGIRAIDDQIEHQETSPDNYFETGDQDTGFEFADRTALEDDVSDTDPDFVGDVGAEAFQRAIEEGEPYFPPTDPVVRPCTGPQDLEITGGFQDTSLDETRVDASVGPGDPPPEAEFIVIRDDEDIRDDVIRELREDALTTDLQVEVSVVNGVVFLKGRVPTIYDAEHAEAVAGRVPGIIEVRDLTEIAEG